MNKLYLLSMVRYPVKFDRHLLMSVFRGNVMVGVQGQC